MGRRDQTYLTRFTETGKRNKMFAPDGFCRTKCPCLTGLLTTVGLVLASLTVLHQVQEVSSHSGMTAAIAAAAVGIPAAEPDWENPFQDESRPVTAGTTAKRLLGIYSETQVWRAATDGLADVE